MLQEGISSSSAAAEAALVQCAAQGSIVVWVLWPPLTRSFPKVFTFPFSLV